MIFDRDTIFAAEVTATLQSMQVEPARTSHRSPWQNGVAERFVGTVRQQLLDHVIVLNEHHLRRLLDSFVGYYHQDRTHLGLGKDSPRGRPVERRPNPASTAISLPRVGGLHHASPLRLAPGRVTDQLVVPSLCRSLEAIGRRSSAWNLAWAIHSTDP
jgi:hypothetical protein